VVPLLDAILPGANLGCTLRTLETMSISSSHRSNKVIDTTQQKKRVGRKIDYIASSVEISVEIFFVEVAGGIAGGTATKAEDDSRKLYKVMKDSLDLYKDILAPTEDEWAKYCVYGLIVNGLCLSLFKISRY
jgi:hypothetical protein